MSAYEFHDLAPMPPDESERLAALQRYAILDTPPEPAFDRLTRLARTVFRVPVAIITLIDADRQWFKSCSGLDLMGTDRKLAFCAYAILSDKVMIVRDAHADARFRHHPLVTGPANLRFYAAAPLKSSGGHRLGTFCVIDTEPREFSEADAATLTDFAAMVSDEMELRLATRQLSVELAERKQIETALQRQQTQLRVLFDLLPAMIWVKDTENHILHVNKRAADAVGKTVEEIEGKSAAELHPEYAKAYYADDLEVICSGAPKMGIIETVPDAHGREIWVQTDKVPYCAPDGKVIGIVVLSQDITARREAEAQIREQAALLDQAPDAILVRDLENVIHFWNKSAAVLYGWTAEEAVGRKVTDLLYLDTAQFDKARRIVIEKGVWRGELRHRGKSGRTITVEGHWTLVRDAAGNPKSILAINTDVTERNQLKAQLFRAQRMESIGTLAGGIAHDLNNMLSPITVAFDLLRFKLNDPSSLEILDTAAASAQRGADLVRQVLSFARGVTGERVVLQPRHLLNEMRKIVAETFPKNLTLQTALAPDLWPVLGDATQLHQVLLNLCVNARDAMPGGGRIEISARNAVLDESYAAMHPDAKPGSYVLIDVQDTGTGIAPEILERIFDPFFTTKEIGKGTGLGLSTSLGIVQSHGGFIRVRSEPGHGASFQIYLPANLEAGPAGACAPKPQPLRGNGECVLLVDDEASIRTITQRALELHGYRVLTASDGVEAITLYAQRPGEIDVVLTDMMMPVMDGPATIAVLRKIQPEVKIIAASGVKTGDQSLGVSHYLPKPYTTEVLLHTLAAILGKTAASASAAGGSL